MDTLLTKALDTGFMLFFSVAMVLFLWLLIKQLPKLINVWTGFNSAIEKNTKVTDQHYNETKSLKQQLEQMNRMLESHDVNASEIRESQAETLMLIRDLHHKVKEMGK